MAEEEDENNRFNSRAHEGRDGCCRRGRRCGPRFNSRAHEGRDQPRRPQDGTEAVSIHAPTRGATLARGWALSLCSFQFTRPRGARQADGDAVVRGRSFNSRAHEGRDTVSGRRPAGTSFQFTRPRGARPGGGQSSGSRCGFQFTRPRGARRTPRATSAMRSMFQFTRPRGARHGHPDKSTPKEVSIHAPTRGATAHATTVAIEAQFQFTRPRGARRPLPSASACRLIVSIHAPTRGATRV